MNKSATSALSSFAGRRSPISITHALQTAWVLVDQGVVSAGSFLTGIIVARQVPMHTYGVYALILGLMLAGNIVHGAVIGYPLMVRGSVADSAELQGILFTALTTGLALSAVMALVMGVGIQWVQLDSGLALAVAFSLISWQLQQVTRCALMSRQRYRAAVPGDLIGYCGQATAVWLAFHITHPKLAFVFGLIGLTSLLASLLQMRQLALFRLPFNFRQEFLRDSWSLGMWSFLSSAINSVMLQLFAWSLTIARGPSDYAKYQAVVNVVGLTHPILFSLTNFLLPAAAIANNRGGPRDALRAVAKRALPSASLMLCALAILFFLARGALQLIYGSGSQYANLDAPLRWMILAYATQLAAIVFIAFLNGIEHPRTSFMSYLAGLVAALLLGVPLVARFGLGGAVGGFCLACAIRASAATTYAFRILDQGRRFLPQSVVTKNRA